MQNVGVCMTFTAFASAILLGNPRKLRIAHIAPQALHIKPADTRQDVERLLGHDAVMPRPLVLLCERKLQRFSEFASRPGRLQGLDHEVRTAVNGDVAKPAIESSRDSQR